MGSPATPDERSALLPGAGEITRPVRGCVGDIVRNRWFRVAMVAKSAFFTLGTVVLLAHGGSISTVLYPRDGNGYLEVPAEAHHAPLWRGDPLVNHPAAPQLNVAWFPVHRGRFVVDQVAERAEDAKKKHDDRMPKWPKHVIGGDHWHDLGVVAGRTDDIAVMYAGKIVEKAPTALLFAEMRHPYTQALLFSIPKTDQPKHTRLTAIAGRPPDLISPPDGCKFAPRCPYAQDRCREEEPVLQKADESGHEFACHFPIGTPENEAAFQRNLEAGVPQTLAAAGRVQATDDLAALEHLVQVAKEGEH